MIVLNEGIGDAQFGELRAVVGLHEKAAGVTDDFWAQLAHAGKRCFNSLHGVYTLWIRPSRQFGRQRDICGPESNIHGAKSAGGLWPGLSDSVERRIAILIIFLIVRAIFAGANSFHPVGVRLVPLDSLAESLIERN